MPECWEQGDWLLVDAAGPALIVGIIRNGDWLDFWTANDGFLESLKPCLASLLGKYDLNLAALSGCLYADGPGSTLGLRLAALFIRSLLQLPQLGHWTCLSYSNLNLACAGQLDPNALSVRRMAAPWRKDRSHLVTFDPGTKSFELSATSSEIVRAEQLQWVILGNRPNCSMPQELAVPYPAERIPKLMQRFPQLLQKQDLPEPYAAEAATFIRWTPERHAAP